MTKIHLFLVGIRSQYRDNTECSAKPSISCCSKNNSKLYERSQDRRIRLSSKVLLLLTPQRTSSVLILILPVSAWGRSAQPQLVRYLGRNYRLWVDIWRQDRDTDGNINMSLSLIYRYWSMILFFPIKSAQLELYIIFRRNREFSFSVLRGFLIGICVFWSSIASFIFIGQYYSSLFQSNHHI